MNKDKEWSKRQKIYWFSNKKR